MQPHVQPEYQQALQQQLDRWQLFAPCPGTNVTIIDPRLGCWHGASGYANADQRQPMSVAARCYIYSITKTFTAARVLQLVENAAIELDAPLVSYRPELTLSPEITVRRLLNHTSGVPNYTSLPDYATAVAAAPGQPWTVAAVVKRTCGGDGDFAPGDGWRYSNTGYMLLKQLIEGVTQQSFATNIDQQIVQPLQLPNTYVATEIDGDRLTPGYSPDFDPDRDFADITPHYHPDWCLTGLIVSTTAEIARFYAALFDGRWLGDRALAAMTTWTPCRKNPPPPQPHAFFTRPSYGLGLMIDPEHQWGCLYGHGGDGPGFNTWAMYLPDFCGRSLTLVIFCNASLNGHPFRLSKNLLRVLAAAG